VAISSAGLQLHRIVVRKHRRAHSRDEQRAILGGAAVFRVVGDRDNQIGAHGSDPAMARIFPPIVRPSDPPGGDFVLELVRAERVGQPQQAVLLPPVQHHAQFDRQVGGFGQHDGGT
jgi:hypothetical protein